MRTFLILVLAFSFILTGCTSPKKEDSAEAVPASGDVEKQTPIEYLKDYHQTVDITNLEDFSDLRLLNEDIKSHKVFFTGEFHSVELNFPTQTKLLFYLNQSADVNYYLAELPFAMGEFINLYLDSGDEQILEYLATESKNTHGEASGYFQLYRDVYQYNQNQPADRRIKFLAIDGDTNPNLALSYLKELASTKAIPEEISQHFDSIQNQIHPELPRQEQSTPALKAYIKSWLDEVKVNEELHKKTFGTDFDKFLFTLISLENGLKEIDANNKNYGDFNVVREGVVKDAFTYWIDRLSEDAKFFGEWGRAHILLSEEKSIVLSGSYSEQVPTLAQYMNEDVPQTKGKVLSIAYMYENSYLNPFRKTEGNSVSFMEEFTHLNMLTPYAKNDVTLFKLNGKNSPFELPNIFVPQPTVNGTLNYFQYVILIRNSKASTSYFDVN